MNEVTSSSPSGGFIVEYENKKKVQNRLAQRRRRAKEVKSCNRVQIAHLSEPGSMDEANLSNMTSTPTTCLSSDEFYLAPFENDLRFTHDWSYPSPNEDLFSEKFLRASGQQLSGPSVTMPLATTGEPHLRFAENDSVNVRQKSQRQDGSHSTVEMEMGAVRTLEIQRAKLRRQIEELILRAISLYDVGVSLEIFPLNINARQSLVNAHVDFCSMEDSKPSMF